MAAVTGTAENANLCQGIAIVSHDASRTGAPLIALNIARELVGSRGIPIVTILLGSGELEPEFARLGPVFLPRYPRPSYQLDPRPWARLIKRIIYAIETAWHGNEDRFWKHVLHDVARRKIRHALCNTVVSGEAAIRLRDAGLRPIGLIHELPHTIYASGWEKKADALVRASDALVFPCRHVQEAFRHKFPIEEKASFIFPQGQSLKTEDTTPEKSLDQRQSIRERLGMRSRDVLVLGCGTGDFRKGIDLFVQAARETTLSAAAAGQKIVFAWAGEIDPNFRVWAEKDATELGMTDRLFFLGPQKEMAPCFAAADIFFLSSREDPFPNVVLEAMKSGLPVVGFAKSGGVEEQLCGNVGVIVPYGNVSSAVESFRELADRSDLRERIGQLGKERIRVSASYPDYVGNLIKTLTRPYAE